MPSTYSGDPANSNRDAVRFLVRDTESPWKLDDREIDWMVSQEVNVYLAAAACADTIAAQAAKESAGAKKVGNLFLGKGEVKAAEYRTLAKVLRRLAVRHDTAKPILTSLRVADKETNEDDDTLVQPSFARGQMDNGGIDYGNDLRRSQG